MSADLRKFAREWDGGCLIRVPEVCRFGPTCLCHLREFGAGGTGLKPPDLVGAIGCDSCHKVIDRVLHLHRFTKEEARLLAFGGLVRTLLVYSEHFVVEARP